MLRARVQKRLAQDFRLDIDIRADAGFTILFGASGAGKTTVLNCIAGLAGPDAGVIELQGRSLFDSSSGASVPVEQRKVGYVFQNLALFPHLTAEENVRYGLHALPAAEQSRRVNEMLESFHVAHLRTRKPKDISGGERQRVALARSLVTDPQALLLDEPLAALDLPTKSRIIEDLRAWNETHRVPILYVTHSREEVFALGERVIVLEGGKVLAEGSPHEVMTAPRQETVAQLAGFENIFDAVVEALHEDRGTMTCRLGESSLRLETPLVKAEHGRGLRVGIRAGDILLATEEPRGLSARNILPGRMVRISQRDAMVMATVDCGIELQVQLTLSARDSLQLSPGRELWAVVKTYSCHLMAAPKDS